MTSLAGRVAIVTGGASGIGRATAMLLARAGHACSSETCNSMWRKHVTFHGAWHSWQPLRCAARRLKCHRPGWSAAVNGRLGYRVVSNAGVGLVKQIPEVSAAEWDAVMDTNFKATFLLARHAIPHSAHRPEADRSWSRPAMPGCCHARHDPVYSTSKMALVGLVQSLALCHVAGSDPRERRLSGACRRYRHDERRPGGGEQS